MTPSCRHHQCMRWVFTLTPTHQQRCIFPEQYPTVSPYCILQSLVVSLVLTHLDYGNATLASVASNQLDRLQSVTNAAAWLVCSARKSNHITLCSRTCNGYEYHSGSSSSSLCPSSIPCMVWLHHTSNVNCTMWQTWTLDGDFVPLQRLS